MTSAWVLAMFGIISSPAIRIRIARSALPHFPYFLPTQLPARASRSYGFSRMATFQTAAGWPGKRDKHV